MGTGSVIEFTPTRPYIYSLGLGSGYRKVARQRAVPGY